PLIVVWTSFMYLIFVTFDFGFALSLYLAFWFCTKDFIYSKRASVFHLKHMQVSIIRFFRTKIYTALILLALVLLFGVLGFRMISGYSWIDSLYMTVITITTVGFGEVQPLDDASDRKSVV